jgi:hypothetical protein
VLALVLQQQLNQQPVYYHRDLYRLVQAVQRQLVVLLLPAVLWSVQLAVHLQVLVQPQTPPERQLLLHPLLQLVQHPALEA